MRIENAIEEIPVRLQEGQERLKNIHGQVEATKEELGKEFPHARELHDKTVRLAELNIALTVQDKAEKRDSEQVGVNFGKLDDKERLMKRKITERDIMALELSENPKINLKPYTKGCFFDGEIAYIDKECGYCVQKAGNNLTLHKLEKMETVPEVGKKVRIAYPKDDGQKARVKVRDQRSRCHRIA